MFQINSIAPKVALSSSEEMPFNAIFDLLNKYINLFIQIITILCIS